MGQRHQVFIRTNNPNYARGEGHNRMLRKDKKTNPALGKGKYTVLAYHHQWLYGRSAAFNAHKMMQLALAFKGHEEDRYRHPNRHPNRHPMAVRFEPWTYTDNLETIGDYFKWYMGIITDEKFPRGIGFENFIFLNPDEPHMREHFDGGDNNDGITIIDLVNKKYCLMNIYEKDDEVRQDVRDLPQFKPVSAVDYVRAYYPDNAGGLNDYVKKSPHHLNNEKAIQEKIDSHKEALAEIEEMFKGMEVMTLEEVRGIFPKMLPGTEIK